MQPGGRQAVTVLDRAEAPSVELADHHSFDGRQLYQTAEGSRVLSAVMEVGGRADEHVHESTTHVFVVIEGELVVGVSGVGEQRVGADQAAVIRAGTPHYAENRGRGQARYIAISLIEPMPEGR